MTKFANIIPIAPYLGGLLTPYHSRQVQAPRAKRLFQRDEPRDPAERHKRQVLMHPAMLERSSPLPERVVRHGLFPTRPHLMRPVKQDANTIQAMAGVMVSTTSAIDINQRLREFFEAATEEGAYTAVIKPSGDLVLFQPQDGDPEIDHRDFQIRLNPDNTYTFVWNVMLIEHQSLYVEQGAVREKCTQEVDREAHKFFFSLEPEQNYFYDKWQFRLPQPMVNRVSQSEGPVQPDATKPENDQFYYFTDKVAEFFTMQESPVMFVLYINEEDQLGFSTLDRPRKVDFTRTASVMYTTGQKYSVVIPALWRDRVTLYKMVEEGVWVRVLGSNEQDDADYYVVSPGRFRLQGLEFELPQPREAATPEQVLAEVEGMVEALDKFSLALLEVKEQFIELGFTGHFNGGVPSEKLQQLTPHKLMSVLETIHPDRFPEAKGLGKRVITQGFVKAVEIIEEIKEHMEKRGIPGWAA
jgi:hypothetical protein